MDKEEIQIIHFHSDGKLAPGLHSSKSDFAASFNRVAVCAAMFPDIIFIAFDIEDTHFHFILKCLLSRGMEMVALFAKLTHMYVSQNGESDIRVVFGYDPVDSEEYCRNVCAYTVIQPTKDGKPVMPFDYPWGSGPLYFRSPKAVPVWFVDKEGNVQTPVTIGSLKERVKGRMFHTHKSLPKDWLVCNGLILPSNYIDARLFEGIFGSHNSYRYLLAKANSDDVKRRMSRSNGVSLPDMEMRRICREKCRTIFHKENIRELNAMERLELARVVRREYLISFSQLSRLVHLPLQEVERYV